MIIMNHFDPRHPYHDGHCFVIDPSRGVVEVKGRLAAVLNTAWGALVDEHNIEVDELEANTVYNFYVTRYSRVTPRPFLHVANPMHYVHDI